jgi:hypothetical protein
MSGRVYDLLTAQFFSPDLFMQSTGNWLNYNRFSYCLNNPTKYVDPSGYLFEDSGDSSDSGDGWISESGGGGDGCGNGLGGYSGFGSGFGNANGNSLFSLDGPYRYDPGTNMYVDASGNVVPWYIVRNYLISNSSYYSTGKAAQGDFINLASYYGGGGGYDLYNVEAFGNNNLVFAIGSLGQTSVNSYGAISFSNSTASVTSIGGWGWANGLDGDGLAGSNDLYQTASGVSYGIGLVSSMIGASARGLTTTSAAAIEMQAAKMIGKIATVARITGIVGNVINVGVNVGIIIDKPTTPSSYARLGVTALSIGLSAIPGVGSGCSLLVSTIDMNGGFNWLYNWVDGQ